MQHYRDLIASRKDAYLNELYPLLKIPSISAENPDGVRECSRWLTAYLTERLGANILDISGEPLPFIVAQLGDDPAKSTVLVYGHYDVQPVDPIDAWHSDPFRPEIRNGRIYARGVGDNKGQFFAHFLAIQLLRDQEGTLPVNLKFLLDPTEEIGSVGLSDFLNAHKPLLKADVLYNADGPVHESGLPTLWFGVKGNIFLDVTLKAARRDAHSQYAALLPSAAWELIHVLAQMRDRNGKVLIPRFYDDVVPLTPMEQELLAAIPDGLPNVTQEFGVDWFMGAPDKLAAARIASDPTFNISGITSGYAGVGRKTVLPSRARVKLDIRLVPDQDPDRIFALVRDFLEQQSRGQVEVHMQGKTYPAKTAVENPFAVAAIRAIRSMGEGLAVLPSIGASNPSDLFQKTLGIPLINASYCNADESNHAPNENMTVTHFLSGILQSILVLKEFGRVAMAPSQEKEMQP